jgi:hypothetical protein
MPKVRTILPVTIEVEAPFTVTTAHAGVLAYLELWCAVGPPDACDRRLRLHGRQGWLTRQLVQAILLINLLGGDCVTGIDRLEQDGGVCALARMMLVPT